MNRTGYHALGFVAVIAVAALALSACGPRVVISTGTTIGLKATPGDGYTRPPQVTFGYKRAEVALVPTAGGKATDTDDAFSTLAAIYFSTQWFGTTELRSFIGTGIAARDIQGRSGSTDGPIPRSRQPAESGPESGFWGTFSEKANAGKASAERR